MNHGHAAVTEPWLTQPVLLHSSRRASYDLTPEQIAYVKGHWRFWYEADHVYALNTVYFCTATIGLFMIANALSKLRISSKPWTTTVAVFRYASYKSYRIRTLRWWSPVLGAMLLGLVGTIFFFAITLGPRPLYWQNSKFGGSQPVATRSGWMAVAMLPFVLALAVKASLITALTGVSHEQLQTFHRWLSYAMFVLALIHTFPFIVKNIEAGTMEMKWSTSVYYRTGVAALVPQAWLTFMSNGPLRNRYYEVFKFMHYVSAVLFVVFFFFHCNFRLSSWDYFIATGAIYVSSIIYSQARTYFVYGLSYKAKLELLPSGVLKVVIPTHPPNAAKATSSLAFAWTPGQHVFVRFLTLGVHAFSSHPFSICSLLPAKEDDHAPEIVCYITPTGGFTSRLTALVRKQPSTSMGVLLDGPYGGLTIKSLAVFDRAVIVAGGSGAGFTLPLIEDILRRQSSSYAELPKEEPQKHLTEIQVVIAARNRETIEWYTEEVELLKRRYCKSSAAKLLRVSMHLTGPPEEQSPTGSIDKEKEAAELFSNPAGFSRGRPDLARAVQTTTAERDLTVGIAVCGPASMLYDVRNAAAEAQVNVVRGIGAKEVYLHSEHFGW
ncbi:hypothetical protein K402DRAFT_171576 [Aulographum hederae CBS 113979]|uniref:ferric-chelate reductase (NADPH) n=1 Tax=Aulographum hederae CBS 113979 TaxID=1176131 RepID=A0A6G1HDJ1_9PEZI|nr:hypothetical protein K402DRAFT_171576 [Aulographum hederae CBS 113979]